MLKKILICAGVFIGILLISVVIFASMISSVNKQKGNNEQILQSQQQPAKKALVVYQPSISDVSKTIAINIAKGLNENGYEVTINNPGDHLSTDVSGYSIVVFGSPTYVGKTSAALNNYIAKIKDFSSGKIVLYSVGSVPDEIIELNELEKQLGGLSAFKKVKFDVNLKSENNKLAFDLGKELAK